MRLHLRAGRAWLGWAAVVLRKLALVVNCFSTANINCSETVALEQAIVLRESLSCGR